MATAPTDSDLATVLVLLYGDYHDAHCRCLESIVQTIPESAPIRIGLNDVCPATLRWLEKGALGGKPLPTDVLGTTHVHGGIPQGRVRYFSSKNENVKKYPMMRRMLWESPMPTKWAVWFDDDSYISDPESAWWAELERCDVRPSHCYLGKRYMIHHIGQQWPFISSRPWFNGVGPQRVGQSGRAGIEFHTGGFVAVRTSLLTLLDWPDPELLHNGGDTLLGEAVRQQGLTMHDFPIERVGIAVNSLERRGYSEKPAGA